MVARDILRRIGLFSALAAGLLTTVCPAADDGQGAARFHVEGFDDETPTWKATADDPQAVRVLGHARSLDFKHAGVRGEVYDIEGRAPLTIVHLEQALPAARVIDELTLSLWVQASQDGVSLSTRVVLPNQKDPHTDQAMVVFIEGSSYEKPGSWKPLTCDKFRTQLTSMLPRLHKRLKSETGERQTVDIRGAYVDAAIVTIRMGKGRSRFALDDLRLGPLVDASSDRELQQVAAAESRPQVDARVDLGRLYVKGQPFFPRIVPYHGERPEDLSRTRLNVVWVRDYADTNLLGELARADLRAMAIPPRPTAADGTTLDPQRVQLAPFGAETAPILFWYLGTGIEKKDKRSVMQWKEQIDNADRQLRRPVIGDVLGLEREFSRPLQMLGVSRAPLHSSFGLMSYRDWLIERRMQASPTIPLWTWIATEAPQEVALQRQAAGWSPQVVEPEQLRLQVYAALAAGYRGLGFWKHSPLDGSEPGALERKLMLTQLCMEIELLESHLANGRVAEQKPFKAQLPLARKLGRLDVAAGSDPSSEAHRRATFNDKKIQSDARDQISRELEAAVINTDSGTLVLPVWYAADAQFVPGQMTANDATVQAFVGKSLQAYEITTTKLIRLPSTGPPGGRQVTLKKFDMTSAILFTDDMALVERLSEKIRAMAETSARVCLELARAKYERVVEVERRIRAFGFGQPDASNLLALADAKIKEADLDWQSKRYHESREHSAECMQTLRILQHAYWSDAVSRIRNHTAVSSPHTLCFQTLPDHWEMVARHGAARHAGGRNVLPSGDFEDRDTIVAVGWKHEQVEVKGVKAVGELYGKPHKGKYCLRLIATAATGEDPESVITERPVTVTTPPVTVYKGQIVHISGWVKVAAPSLGNLDGAMLYDSLAGPAMALRWRIKTDWQPFELIREVTETTDLTIAMTLSGLGEICFDDLQIIPLDAEARPASPGGKVPNISRTGQKGAFDFLKKLPVLGTKKEPE